MGMNFEFNECKIGYQLHTANGSSPDYRYA